VSGSDSTDNVSSNASRSSTAINTAECDGRHDVLAVGRVVADNGWAGVFGMAMLPQARGKGAARTVLVALADWAGAHEADRMYLQVECDNIPAFRLYSRAGFGEVCDYHYRTAG
jgi:ribosomal protein S18 acetylase RimI-like enzyme